MKSLQGSRCDSVSVQQACCGRGFLREAEEVWSAGCSSGKKTLGPIGLQQIYIYRPIGNHKCTILNPAGPSSRLGEGDFIFLFG